MTFAGRMSEAEALLWRLDRDPALSGTFGNLTLLDRAPDVARLRRRLEWAAGQIPRLRQRVQPGPTPVIPPSWVDDPLFDIDFHVRRVALPKPATLDRLAALAALLIADPFERTRPLWQVTVVEGLRGGRAAVIEKLHHSVADGEIGMQFAMSFMDPAPDTPDPAPKPPSDAASRPDPVGAALGTLGEFTNLADVGRLVADSAESIKSAVAQLADLEPAHSPLWTQRSLRRSLELLAVPLEPLRASARGLGGTLTTALLTVIAEAAGRYHRELGAPVESLRASLAISTRTAASGTNAFTLGRLAVPTGTLAIERRFETIHAEATRVRELAAAAPLERIAIVGSVLPTSVITRLARQQSHTVDFGVSTLRGASIPVYIAGARVLANHPIGPLVGTPLNATAMSSHTSLDIGLHIDPAAIAEPALMKRRVNDAFRKLLRAAGAA